MADNKVQVQITGSFDGLTSALQGAQAQIEGMAAPVQELASSFAGIGQAVISGFAIDRIVDFAAHMNELGERTLHAAETLGMSVSTFSALSAAMNFAGVGADSAAMALMRLERSASEAQRGGANPLADAFRRLGISVTDSNGKLKDGQELLMEVADRFKDAPNDINKLDVAWQIFGRGLGDDLLPFLNRGADGIRDLMAAAQGSGAAIDEGVAKPLADAAEQTRKMTAAYTGLGEAIEAKTGIITETAKGWTDIAEAMSRALNATNALKLDNVLDQIAQVRAALIRERDEAVKLYTEAPQSVAYGLASEMVKQLELQLDQLEAERLRITEATRTENAPIPGHKPIPPPAPEGRGGADKAAMQEDRDLEREMNDELRQRIELIDSGQAVNAAYYRRLADDARLALAQGKTSAAEELRTLTEEENEKYGLLMRSLQQKLALYRQDEAAYAQVQDRMKIATEQHLAAIDQLEIQAAAKAEKTDNKMAQDWKSALEPMNRAFDGMLQGVLQGTQTLSQALAKAFSDIAISFIEQVAKMMAQWLAFEVMTAGFGIGAGAMPFGNPFGASAGGLGGLIGMGVSGLGSLVGFDVGAWSVPATMPAIVHAGEMILPADLAASIRGGGGMGGGVNLGGISITALDSRSVQQLFNSPGISRAITAMVQRALATNPSLQGAF